MLYRNRQEALEWTQILRWIHDAALKTLVLRVLTTMTGLRTCGTLLSVEEAYRL